MEANLNASHILDGSVDILVNLVLINIFGPIVIFEPENTVKKKLFSFKSRVECDGFTINFFQIYKFIIHEKIGGAGTSGHFFSKRIVRHQ
jgi:hypothetical protein